MFDPTDAQGKIIEEFIDYDAEKKGNVGYGLSSGGMEKRGINRRTFVNNVDDLVSNNFLYLTHSKIYSTRKKNKEIKSPWNYYVVSHLGVLAYIKWATRNNKDFSITKKFFPLITKHMKELQKLYGYDIISLFFQKTVDQINVKPQGQITSPNHEQRIKLKKLNATMTLPIQDLEVTFTDFIGEPKTKEIKRFDGLEYDFDYSQNETIDKTITDRFTFAFYFNLINASQNANELLNLALKANPPFFKKGKKVYQKNLEELTKFLKQFQTKIEKNSKLITSIINNDPELHKLFTETLSDLNSQLSKAKIIKHLQQSIK